MNQEAQPDLKEQQKNPPQEANEGFKEAMHKKKTTRVQQNLGNHDQRQKENNNRYEVLQEEEETINETKTMEN